MRWRATETMMVTPNDVDHNSLQAMGPRAGAIALDRFLHR
jgi:hypothetical protein